MFSCDVESASWDLTRTPWFDGCAHTALCSTDRAVHGDGTIKDCVTTVQMYRFQDTDYSCTMVLKPCVHAWRLMLWAGNGAGAELRLDPSLLYMGHCPTGTTSPSETWSPSTSLSTAGTESASLSPSAPSLSLSCTTSMTLTPSDTSFTLSTTHSWSPGSCTPTQSSATGPKMLHQCPFAFSCRLFLCSLALPPVPFLFNAAFTLPYASSLAVSLRLKSDWACRPSLPCLCIAPACDPGSPHTSSAKHDHDCTRH